MKEENIEELDPLAGPIANTPQDEPVFYTCDQCGYVGTSVTSLNTHIIQRHESIIHSLNVNKKYRKLLPQNYSGIKRKRGDEDASPEPPTPGPAPVDPTTARYGCFQCSFTCDDKADVMAHIVYSNCSKRFDVPGDTGVQRYIFYQIIDFFLIGT